MVQLLNGLSKTSYSAQSNLPSPAQELSVLDAFGEGVFIARADNQNDADTDFELIYTNKSLRKLMPGRNELETGNSVHQAFPNQLAKPICEALGEIRNTNSKGSKTLRGLQIHGDKLIDIVLLPHMRSKKNTQFVGLIQNEKKAPEYEKSLENRALLAIDNANIMESTRRDLEKEILRLRSKLSILERTSRYDKSSSLPNRQYFLERAAGEFRRSKRYDHYLSLVVVEIAGFHAAVKSHGAESGDDLISGLAQIWEATGRHGIDIAGRISQSQIAILLPETSLTGAFLFVDRFKSIIEETPVQCGNSFVRMGIHTSTETAQFDDTAFAEPFSRALYGLGAQG